MTMEKIKFGEMEGRGQIKDKEKIRKKIEDLYLQHLLENVRSNETFSCLFLREDKGKRKFQ